MTDQTQNEVQLFKYYIDTQFLPFTRTYEMRSVVLEFNKLIDEYLEEETEKKTVNQLLVYLTMRLTNKTKELLDRIDNLDNIEL